MWFPLAPRSQPVVTAVREQIPGSPGSVKCGGCSVSGEGALCWRQVQCLGRYWRCGFETVGMKVAEVVHGQVGEQTRCDTHGPLTAEPFKLET